MNNFNIILLCISIFSLTISVFFVIYCRRKMRNTMDRLNKMLDDAISGSFTEATYDESSLSAFEGRLNRYLCASLSSKKNISEERDKIKTLISDISHQTKTPISNIILYSQLLYEQLLEKQLIQEKIFQEKLPEHLSQEQPLLNKSSQDNWKSSGGNVNIATIDMAKQIINQSTRLNFLIQALVKTSRLETGIISISAKPDSVLKLITSIHNEEEQKAQTKNITIEISCPETGHDEVIAVFDFKWTQEALCNILDNSIKYTPDGGKIHISVAPYELFCRIDFSDNGIGIHEDEFNAIFQRFYRSPMVNRYEGVGLGLYLSREIISSQGGYIKVSSVIGQGSTFSVFLPRQT